MTGRLYLSHGWHKGAVEKSAHGMELLRTSEGHPLVRRWFPNGAYDQLFYLWENRGTFIEVLDGLPQTFCHLDAFRRNIVARKSLGGAYESVLLDWAFAGIGAIGEELVPLILSSIFFFEIDFDQYQALEEHALNGCLAGLADVGCRLDPRQIRLGYAAASIRYQFGDMNLLIGAVLDEAYHYIFPPTFGRSVTECVDQWARLNQKIQLLTAEVAPLLEELG